MQTSILFLDQHLFSDSSALWLLLLVAVPVALQRLTNIIIVLIALFSDEANARLVKLILAAKK